MRKLIFSLGLLGGFSLPLLAFALPSGLPFGGLVDFAVPCTCTPQGGFAIYLTPGWFGLPGPLPPPTTGALYYPLPPSSLLYAYFEAGIPGTFELGTWLPAGGGVEQCLTGVPPACTIVPTEGSIIYMGTSSLAPISIFDF